MDRHHCGSADSSDDLGAFLDRWQRLRALATLDLVRAGVVLGIPLAWRLGWFDVWTFVVFGVALASLDAFFLPALQSSLPQLVPREELRPANGAVDFTQRVGRIAGPGLSGLILAAVPIIHFFTIDAATFLFSGLIFVLLYRTRRPSPADPKSARGSRLSSQELLEGWRLTRERPELLRIFTVRSLNNVLWGAYLVGAPVIVAKHFGRGAGVWGLIIVWYSAGQLAGNLFAANSRRLGSPLTALTAGWCITGLGFVGFGLAGSVPLASAAVFVAGVGGPVAHVTTDAYISRTVPDLIQGRVFALHRTTIEVALTAKVALAGLTFEALHPARAMSAAGVGMILVGLLGSTGSRARPTDA